MAIPLGASGAEAELPFTLYDENGSEVAGYLANFLASDGRVRLVGGSFANWTVSQIVEWGYGVYAYRLLNSQTLTKGNVGLRVQTVAPTASILFKQFYEIGNFGIPIQVGTNGAQAELAFSLYDAITGAELTGLVGSFLPTDGNIRLPNGSFANWNPAQIVEWGNGVYGYQLTALETANAGSVGLRVLTASSGLFKQFYEIRNALGFDALPPTLTIISPPQGAVISPGTEIIFRYEDNNNLRRPMPMFKIAQPTPVGAFRYELIHDGDNFTPDYTGTKTVIQASPAIWEYRVSRRGGWTTPIIYSGVMSGGNLELVPFGTDTSGNELV